MPKFRQPPPIICPGRVVRDLTLRVIEWKPRIIGRKIYFGGESGVVLGSLAANVTAPGFEFSAYEYSPFFNEMAKANLLEFEGLALEPWLVEAALARLGRRLSPADQRTIVKATRTPHKVRWPEWWSEHP
jgi:hypothetical protein